MSTTLSDADRMLNIGIEVTLKKGTVCYVKELSLEGVMKVSKEIILLLNKFMPEIEKGGTGWVAKVIAEPELLAAIKDILAISTELPLETFNNLSISEWLKLFNALKVACDWDGIKQLFFDLVGSKANLLSLAAGMQKARPAVNLRTADSQE